MATLNYTQLKSLAQQVGLNDAQASIAAAIALAESGGNTDAYNPELAAGTATGHGSRGLWQIYGSAHPQYDNSTMFDPLSNARAMATVSNQGTNWKPWTTYTSGAYRQYMQAGGGSSTSSPGSVPWYLNSFVNDYGSPDPFGGFPKPDINVSVPSGVPITALFSGTVSGIDTPGGGTPAWGHVVTVKLDSAINSVATHTAYLHLAQVNAKVGQKVNAGDTVGISGGNNPGPGLQQAPVGFALTNGDSYGFGPTWSQYLGSSQLDPTSLWNNLTKGGITIPLSASTSNPIDAISNFLSANDPLFAWITNPVRIIKLVTGVLILIVALYLLITPTAAPLAKQFAVATGAI